jgi:hypothetical protein
VRSRTLRGTIISGGGGGSKRRWRTGDSAGKLGRLTGTGAKGVVYQRAQQDSSGNDY